MKKLSNYKNYNNWAVDILKSDKTRTDRFLKLAMAEFKKDGDVATLLVSLRQVSQVNGSIAQLKKESRVARKKIPGPLAPIFQERR